LLNPAINQGKTPCQRHLGAQRSQWAIRQKQSTVSFANGWCHHRLKQMHQSCIHACHANQHGTAASFLEHLERNLLRCLGYRDGAGIDGHG
jgi:hypothetical protein